MQRVGLPTGTRFHDLRHFYASLLIDGGESVKAVQTRLGHATAEETLNTYAHLWPESADRAREAVDRGLRRPPSENGTRGVDGHALDETPRRAGRHCLDDFAPQPPSGSDGSRLLRDRDACLQALSTAAED